MNIYHIQDCDRPLFVFAENWTEALDVWKHKIATENDLKPHDVEEPQGITLIAERDDIVLPAKLAPTSWAELKLRQVREIIEAVDNRCAAADGAVTPTLQEMTQAEISRIYKLAGGVPAKQPKRQRPR